MISSATSRFPVWLKSSSISRRTTALELPPIGWQLFILGNSKSDSTAFPLFLDTYASRLLAEPLSWFSRLSTLVEALCVVWTSGNATPFGPMPTHVIIPTRLPRPPRVCAFDPRPPRQAAGWTACAATLLPALPALPAQPAYTNYTDPAISCSLGYALETDEAPSRHLRKLGPCPEE